MSKEHSAVQTLAFMQCLDCAEISKEVEIRIEILTELGRDVERLTNSRGDRDSLETNRELAGILMQYQMAKSEVDGLKIALEIHQRNHQSSSIGAGARYGSC